MFEHSLPSTARRPAFTLIELLVVISILALFATILFPVFGRVRENARRTSCASNLKQIGLGIAQYTQDNDDVLPGCGADNVAATWRSRTAPYILSTQLFVCPSRGYRSPYSVGSLRESLRADGYAGSYAANGMRDYNYGPYGGDCNSSAKPQGCTPMSIGNDGTRGKVLSMVVAPAETLMITEAGVRGNSAFDWGGADFNIWSAHLRTMNVLFCDGHVKAMRPLDTATPKNLWTVMEDGPMDTTLPAWSATYGLVFQQTRYDTTS